mmetsp:Transcript_41295/g.82684  ORF Transcript_41295/g.82684 Transcript_41295/m.82684 type:complete len:327 (-) Transcript_41295:5-985(-)
MCSMWRLSAKSTRTAPSCAPTTLSGSRRRSRGMVTTTRMHAAPVRPCWPKQHTCSWKRRHTLAGSPPRLSRGRLCRGQLRRPTTCSARRRSRSPSAPSPSTPTPLRAPPSSTPARVFTHTPAVRSQGTQSLDATTRAPMTTQRTSRRRSPSPLTSRSLRCTTRSSPLPPVSKCPMTPSTAQWLRAPRALAAPSPCTPPPSLETSPLNLDRTRPFHKLSRLATLPPPPWVRVCSCTRTSWSQTTRSRRRTAAPCRTWATARLRRWIRRQGWCTGGPDARSLAPFHPWHSAFAEVHPSACCVAVLRFETRKQTCVRCCRANVKNSAND